MSLYSGPSRWPSMFPTCSDNRRTSRQSPINILSSTARPYEFPRLVIPRNQITNVTIENNGHSGTF